MEYSREFPFSGTTTAATRGARYWRPWKPLPILPGVLGLLLVACSSGIAQPLVWVESKAEAFALARSQQKKVLLFAGRPTCAECIYMETVVIESTNYPVKALIQSEYIPWSSDVDTSNEWVPYAAGLSYIALPMICTIDPTNSTDYMDRTIDIQSTKTFYTRLLNRAGIQLTNVHFGSLCLSNGAAILGLDHLTFGATNYLERRVESQLPGDWTPVTNFVSLSRTNSVVDPQDPGTKAVFYRMWSTR